MRPHWKKILIIEFKKLQLSPWSSITVFLIAIVSLLSYFFISHQETKFHGQPLEQSYSTLRLSVQQGGLIQFQSDKKELKQQILKILQSPQTEEEEINASNIALYLFPELLPDDHLEKRTALDYWAPLEAAIEKKPRTAEARMLFEELKSNIWNYENPKVNNVGLSMHAIETLNIYHELSSP